MRERKYVKLRVDMYEDTKFKIIDMKPERDVIYYIWSRILLLAGKVNLEGELYLSKSMPYTIETLAIDFNRDISQVKLALDVFLELQMIELTEDNVYKVSNFAKHQNIKKKAKELSKNNEVEVNNDKAALNENLEVETIDEKINESEDRTVENGEKHSVASKVINLEIISKAADIAENSIDGNNKEDKLQKDGTITKKSGKRTRKKKDTDTDISQEEFLNKEDIDEESNGFIDGDITVATDERIVLGWSFG